MSSATKHLAMGIIALLLFVLLVGFLALSEPYIKGLTSNVLINQSNQSDLIVSIHERFINSLLQYELEERQPEGLKNVTVFFNEGGPVEVLAELEISLGFATVNPKIKVEANLSAENNTLKVRPESIALGKLNLPRSTWIGPLNTAIGLVEDAANQSISETQKGFKITGVYIGEHYLTLTIDVPPPDELKKALQKKNSG
ncbi:MAG: hypothetical protein MUO26_12380 [Methanotrichaceae archaeon]|nr:hypothetical protein [Methanotrichaceae archaeon]